ncbi:immunoglobulin domain-containing protein [Vibrio diazotrophicus]|uniref:immunoglobulin domain-containing protein n=1 Tax=Vibrio diazotrophicus TaxID=685 RepID=UPI00142E8933|nr:immunoglobulin domain-containing protein [Vibrio diazotrophicus]NIY91090.1 hypothetical protein [Vibrio diazotrophicus]
MALYLNEQEILALTLDGTEIETVTLDGVIVARKPSITTQPVGGSISEGDSHNLSIEVDGLGSTLSYQWYEDGVAISGATDSSYVFTSGVANEYTFKCKVSGFGGYVESDSVNVTVEANGSRHTLTVGHKTATLYDIWGFLDEETIGDFQPRNTDLGDSCTYLGVTVYIDDSQFGGLTFTGSYKSGQVIIDIEGLDTINCETSTNDDVFGVGSYGCLFDSTTSANLLALLSTSSGSTLSVNIQFSPN